MITIIIITLLTIIINLVNALTTTARLFVSLLVAFSFPLQCHPSRCSIINLLSHYYTNVDGSDERVADRSNGIDVAYSTIHMRSSHDSIDVRVNDDDDDDDEVVEVKENDYDHDYGVDEDDRDHSDHHHGRQHHYDSIHNGLIDIPASINCLDHMPDTQDITTTITTINSDTIPTVHDDHHNSQYHLHHDVVDQQHQQQESSTRFTLGQYDMI
jgi:hypothetical protein